VDYVDKWFADNDRKSLEDEGLYVQLKEVAQPFIDKWMVDPLANHHALHDEMKAAILTFLKKHNPESADQTDRVLDQLNR